jgi:hypothetical protein
VGTEPEPTETVGGERRPAGREGRRARPFDRPDAGSRPRVPSPRAGSGASRERWGVSRRVVGDRLPTPSRDGPRRPGEPPLSRAKGKSRGSPPRAHDVAPTPSAGSLGPRARGTDLDPQPAGRRPKVSSAEPEPAVPPRPPRDRPRGRSESDGGSPPPRSPRGLPVGEAHRGSGRPASLDGRNAARALFCSIPLDRPLGGRAGGLASPTGAEVPPNGRDAGRRPSDGARERRVGTDREGPIVLGPAFGSAGEPCRRRGPSGAPAAPARAVARPVGLLDARDGRRSQGVPVRTSAGVKLSPYPVPVRLTPRDARRGGWRDRGRPTPSRRSGRPIEQAPRSSKRWGARPCRSEGAPAGLGRRRASVPVAEDPPFRRRGSAGTGLGARGADVVMDRVTVYRTSGVSLDQVTRPSLRSRGQGDP